MFAQEKAREMQAKFDKEFKAFEEIYSKCNNINELGAKYNRLVSEIKETIIHAACCYAFENRFRELKEGKT